MSSLESLIRPFSSPAPQGSILIPSSPSTTTEKAVLKWGASGPLPTPQGLSVKTECCNNSNDEFSRDWEDVKVFSKDSPDNFITVRRTKALSMHQKTDKSKCDDGWNQVSAAAQEVTADLAALDANFGDSSTTGKDSCKGTYNLNNNTVAEPAPNPGGTGTTTSDAGTGGLATSTSEAVDADTGLPVGSEPVSPGEQTGVGSELIDTKK